MARSSFSFIILRPAPSVDVDVSSIVSEKDLNNQHGLISDILLGFGRILLRNIGLTAPGSAAPNDWRIYPDFSSQSVKCSPALPPIGQPLGSS